MTNKQRAALSGEVLRKLESRVAEAARRLRAPHTRAVAQVPTECASGEPFPLTDVQQAYLVGRLDDMDLGGVGCHSYTEFDATGLNVKAFQEALAALIRRHGMLRAVVVQPDRQKILTEVPDVEIPFEDLSAIPDDVVTERLRTMRAAMSHRRFDLSSWPWFEFRITLLPANKARLHVSIDVMMVDGSSLRLMFAELRIIYLGLGTLEPEPALSFQDYLALREAARQPERVREDEAYWDEWLQRMPSPPDLPTAPVRSERAFFARRSMRLAAGEWGGIKACAQQLGVPVVSLLIATYAETLFRWSASERFCLNLTSYDRQPLHPDVGRLIGNFTSVVLLAVHPGAWLDAVQAARQVHEMLWEAIDHRDISGVEVLRRAARSRAGRQAIAARTPVVFTSMIGTGTPDASVVESLRETFGVSQTPQVLLDCQVYEDRDDLCIAWDAREDAFPAGVLDAMFAAFAELLRHTWRAGIPAAAWLPARERPAPFAVADGTTGLLHEGFLKRAIEQPTSRAVQHDGRVISYAELLERAESVAARVASFVSPVVAVSLPKGIDQIVAVLGIVMAGRSYVPLATDLPQLRIAHMLALSGAGLVLTDADGRARLESHVEAALWVLAEARDSKETGWRLADVKPDDLAYVIFTSGSTGVPKGVCIRHGAAINTIMAVNRELSLGPDDAVLGVSSLSFDLSVYDIFGTLAAGACLILPDESQGHDPAKWLALIRDERVTVWNSVPALFEIFVEELERRGGEASEMRLRWALLSGDWIPVGLSDRAKATMPGLEVMSLGGATEASIWSVWHHIAQVAPEAVSIPYGKAMPGQRLLVLDPQGNLCPTWVAGDLYIDGLGLSDGYLGLEAETAQAFAPHPGTGMRMYRTGDRARLLPTGELEFLGRFDRQTKIHGYRVELGEVEQVLRSHPQVSRCAVAIVESTTGRAQLIAYVVPCNQLATVQDLAFHLSQRLPHYMVPDQLVMLKELPLNANGKLDLAALPRTRDGIADELKATSPSAATAVANIVMSLFDAVLGGGPAAWETDLLKAGGTSLDAVRIVVRARDVFRVQLSLRSFVTEPTVSKLTALVLEGRTGVKQTAQNEVLRLEHRKFPLSPPQMGLWALYLADPGDLSYNTVDGFLVRGRIDVQLFSQAVADIVARHDALRTIFVEDPQANVFQCVLDAGPSLRVVDGGEKDSLHALASTLALQEASRPFNLREAPPVRFTLARHDGQHSVMIVAMHHIICDAWSLNVLLHDLFEAYDARASARLPEPPPRLQPGDFFAWRLAGTDARAIAALQEGWRRLLLAPPLRMPLPAPAEYLPTAAQGRRLYFVLSEDTAKALRRLAIDASASLYVVLLHRFALALGELTGSTDMVIGTPVADRFHPLTEPLVGMFINTLPVRLTLTPGSPVLAGVKAAREQVLAAMDLQELPFHEIVQAVNPPRVPGQHPLFSVMFALQEREAPIQGGIDLVVEPMAFELASAKFDLTLECRPVAEGIACFIEYRLGAVAASFVDRLRIAFEQGCTALHGAPTDGPFAPIPTVDYLAYVSGCADVGEMLPATGLVGFVLAQAQRTPTAVAIDAPQECISYSQMVIRASHIAAMLRPVCQSETVIAVQGGCTAATVIAVLGVLMAGGAFTMLDPANPSQRVSEMLACAGIGLLIDANAGGPKPAGVQVLDLRGRSGEAGSVPAQTAGLLNSDALAYVAFTSGSTGQPSAVALTHMAIGTRIAWSLEQGTVKREDRVLMMTPVGFDVAVCEIFETLAAGGVLVTSPATDFRSAVGLVEALDANRISVINLTPSLLGEVLRCPGFQPGTLRRVNCGAEPLSQEVMESALALMPGVELYNFYGLTECAVDTTMTRCWPGKPVSVGQGIAGAQILLLDDRLAPVAPGVPGEVWITGPGLARGYLGRPELTAARFLPRPGGGRMYRTGDRGRWLADGNLTVLGRLDEQVKIRGVRIELAEVAQAIRQHPDIDDCMVLVQQTEFGATLAALFVGDGVAPGELRTHIHKLLPTIFVPSRIAAVQQLPRNANGKLDRDAALRMLAERFSASDQRAPRDALEQVVAQLFGELLGSTPNQRDADFFDLGGHSLMAGRLTVLLGARFGVRVTIGDIIESPTVEALAERVRSASPKTSNDSVVLREGSSPGLFLIHSLGGEVVCYLPLAREMRQGPKLTGLRVTTLDGLTVETLARSHAATIQRLQPSGPCRVAGWSAGGVLAVAVAAELERSGREVEQVVLIDSVPVSLYPDEGADTFFRMALAEIAPSHVQPDPPLKNSAEALAWIRDKELLPWQSAEPELAARLEVARVLDHALRSHFLERIMCPLTLVQSDDAPDGTLQAWTGHSSGGMKALKISATHYSILEDRRLAAVLDLPGNTK